MWPGKVRKYSAQIPKLFMEDQIFCLQGTMKLPCEIKMTKNLYTVSDLHVLLALSDFFKMPTYPPVPIPYSKVTYLLATLIDKQFVSLCE